MSATTKSNNSQKAIVKKKSIAKDKLKNENLCKVAKKVPQHHFEGFERRVFRDIFNILQNIKEFNVQDEMQEIQCSSSTFPPSWYLRKRRDIVLYQDTPEEAKIHDEANKTILKTRADEILRKQKNAIKDGQILNTPGKDTINFGSSKLPIRTPDSLRLKRTINEATQKLTERAGVTPNFGCTKIPVLTPEKLNCIYNNIKRSTEKKTLRTNSNVYSNLVAKKQVLGKGMMTPRNMKMQQKAELSEIFQSTFKRRRMLL